MWHSDQTLHQYYYCYRFLYPDGTPVSYTEAAALRRYTTGTDDFVFLAQNKSNPANPYILVTPSGWPGWPGDGSSAPRLFELTLWPDSVNGNITVSVGDLNIVIDAVPLPYTCQVTRQVSGMHICVWASCSTLRVCMSVCV